MAFTTSDNRKHRQPIARRKLTLTTLVSENNKSVGIPINGDLLQYIVDAPTLLTDSAYDFTITNDDGETLYSNTGMVETVSTTVLLSAAPIPLSGTVNFTISFTTAQVTEFEIYLYYK